MAYLLEAERLSKYFGASRVFAQVSLSLKEGEKAGLVGANGAGKTTLLNCLAGRDSADEGNVRLAPYASIGFLEQTQDIREGDSLLSSVMSVFADVFAQRGRIGDLEQAMSKAEGQVLEDILARYGNETEEYERAGGFAAETQVRRVLHGLGFREEEFGRQVGSFSGGEKTRIGLARILVREYPLLFLDEPTNHLDLASVEWLERFLKDYAGALLIISHDRYFLDSVTETTYDLENGSLKRYAGGYSRYAAQKEEDRKAMARAYDKQQKEIDGTQAYILRFKAGIKAKQARGRQARLDRLRRLEKPAEGRAMHMGKADILRQAGEKVLILDNLSYAYTDEQLFSDLHAEIRNEERVALLGPNGAGKTTVLKLIAGRLKPLRGEVYLGPGVKPAYFDQEHQNLNPENTVLEEILARYDLTVEEAKNHLARFLFAAEDWEKKIAKLSGGERGRLSLLKLTLEKGNFLVLDEPTNHLDIQSREIMEAWLDDFPGTLLMVSHDRYFIDTLADRVLELSPEGLISYPGNYSAYRERKERLEKLSRKAAAGDTPAKAPSAKNQPAKNPPDAAKQGDRASSPAREEHRIITHSEDAPKKPPDRYAKAKLRRRLQDLEKEIAELEAGEIFTVEALGNPETYSAEDINGAALKELRRRLSDIQTRLPEAYREWEETGRQLEDA